MVVASTAAFHARVRGSVPGLGGLKETRMFLTHPLVKLSIAGSLRDQEVACSASDRQGSNFESCVWRTVSSHSSHHPQEVLLAQFSLYVHKGGLKPDSFHLISLFLYVSCAYILCALKRHPSKHGAFTQCCFNVGPASTLVTNIKSHPIPLYAFTFWCLGNFDTPLISLLNAEGIFYFLLTG